MTIQLNSEKIDWQRGLDGLYEQKNKTIFKFEVE